MEFGMSRRTKVAMVLQALSGEGSEGSGQTWHHYVVEMYTRIIQALQSKKKSSLPQLHVL